MCKNKGFVAYIVIKTTIVWHGPKAFATSDIKDLVMIVFQPLKTSNVFFFNIISTTLSLPSLLSHDIKNPIL